MKKTAVQSGLWARLREAIIHPLAFAVFPVLSLYVENVGKGFLREAVGIAAGVLVLAALLWLLIGVLVKDRGKSAIIVSVFSVLFFSYGHAISAVRDLLERMQALDTAGFLVEGKSGYIFWIVIWAALFAVASYSVVRLRTNLRQVTNFLNIVALALMVMLGVNAATVGANEFLMPRIRGGAGEHASGGGAKVDYRASANEFIASWREHQSSESAEPLSGSLPDIYYVILDMYARADTLEEIYGFDNSEFLSFLTNRGFYIASKSRTNYPHTTHSLASSLNLTYLDEVADQIGERSTNFWPLIVMIRNNKVMQGLRNHGYTTVAFATGHEFSEIRGVDVFVEPPGWRPSNFQHTLMGITPLAMFRGAQDDFRREIILYILDHLVDATKIGEPTFVFAHIAAPHSPYVFGANGEPVQSRPETEYEYDEYVEAYTNQLAFVSQRMQIVIEDILSQSAEPPIIIVQADHGPNSNIYISRPEIYFPERMSIFSVYYFPDQNYDDLYEDITPVNTFRVIFNNYLGADYEILEDRSYFSKYDDSPYLFVDVTDKALTFD